MILQGIGRVTSGNGDVVPAAPNERARLLSSRPVVNVPFLIVPNVDSPALVVDNVTGFAGPKSNDVNHGVMLQKYRIKGRPNNAAPIRA